MTTASPPRYDVSALITALMRPTLVHNMARAKLPGDPTSRIGKGARTTYANACAEVEAIVHKWVHEHPAECCEGTLHE